MRNEELVKGMSNCVNHCNWCADACLNEENLKDMVECIRLDKACAAVCRALNDILVTEYKDVQNLVDYCIEMCEKCAEECEKFDSKHCKDCAEACRECAKNLRNFRA
ncbi:MULTISPECIES: four-helix bundle copper-binding protein [Flavobacteriaceae]|uniref:Four-helix bundle copper-binding protein n=1 Tax=Autumnicola psychrophila TaxID=3075592 RepID=A0ABU3DRJ9_9FLAO|nr:four-helix bundle copper-binding protein [Zunongwangia sp. F225]MDT0686343.1 four-helix bundle copper-binding protein [Zunongwangia sp. F225]